MGEILHHLRCMKPCRWWDILLINWCRISSINSMIIKILNYIRLIVRLLLFVKVSFQEKIAHVGTTNKIHLTCSDDPIFSCNCSVDTESFGKWFCLHPATDQLKSQVEPNRPVEWNPWFSAPKDPFKRNCSSLLQWKIAIPQMTMEWV